MRLLAIGLLGACALIATGWYVSSRANRENAEATTAATPTDVWRVVDEFSRANGPLDGDDPAWSVLGGEWSIVGEQLQSDGSGQASLAVTNTEWSDISVGLVVGTSTQGSGLLFRVIDFNNHWALVASPDFATWNLVLTVDGEVTQSVPTGLSGTDPGTRLAVLAQGPEIQVFVNGVPVAGIVDPTFELATTAGVFASPGAVATFDDFFAVEAAPPGA